MKRLLPFLILSAFGIAVFLLIAPQPQVLALGVMDGVNAAHGTGTPTALFGSTGIVTTVTNTLLFIAGALSVIMIIFGGLRYVLSGGNSSAVTAAKNTVLYAIVGLIIAFLAFAAVNFVLGSVSSIGGGVAPTNL